jgi:hypothetical protein
MLALSIRQPYAELILRGVKTIESATADLRLAFPAMNGGPSMLAGVAEPAGAEEWWAVPTLLLARARA